MSLLRLAMLLPACLVACASGSAPAHPHAEPRSAHAAKEPGTATDPAAPKRPMATPVEPMAQESGERVEPLVLITDPGVLIALERGGVSFSQLLLGRSEHALAALRAAPRMRALEAVLRRDIEAIQRRDSRAGVGMRFAHRLFDLNWLRSAHAHFELIGVVNRLDRAVFAPAHCGEVRLVFRLAYQTQAVASRLPMTLNLVFFQPRSASAANGKECQAAARRWQREEQGEALAAALRSASGPLHPDLLSEPKLKSLELDIQAVRWPSTTRPDMGGHAQYVLRVLVPDGEGWGVAPLENTPRPNLGGAERAQLRTWILENLEAIDAGTAVMPAALADTESTSVTPLGLGRLANRPFGRLFSASDFEDLDLQRFTHIASPQALLRRLDGMSCAGCHQTRSVAGFHLLGEDSPDKRLDALHVAGSPHLFGELPRRRAYVRALLAGGYADPARPHSDHEPSAGGFGTHCALGSAGLETFRCAEGLRCESHGDPVMGTCVPVDGGGAGAACEVGVLMTRSDPLRDRVHGLRARPCGRGVCNGNRVGFPQGMCTASCEGLGDGESCGSIVALRPFNDCIARGEPFTRCIESSASAAGLRFCSEEVGCRDDYLCARGREQAGVCIPPYFLFQLRVDGHVVPL